jgi:two-component system NtrC family sensor kinase
VQIKHSIHDRLVLWIGTSIALILMFLFFVIMAVQKEAIIGKHRSIAVVMVQTALIPLNDALHLSQNDSEDFLQGFLNSFTLEYQDQVRYVMVLDREGRVEAHSDVSQIDKIFSDVYSRSALEALEPQFHLFDDPSLGWVMEVSAPLGLITLSHGAVRLGLDGQPLISELRRTTLIIIALFATALITVISIVMRVSRNLTRKLRRTAEAMDTLDFLTETHLVLPEGDDEIGLLNDRFLKLQERLIESRSIMEQTTQSLIRTEKLAALGRMAAGVAHEINNPLMGLKNCLQLLKIDPDHKDDHIRLLKEGLDRIEDTVKSLLNGARRKSGETRDFDVNASVRDVLNLIGHRLSKEKVITRVDLDERIPIITNNKSGLEEALLNICMNALDAIGGVGTISLKTEAVGGRIRITICDSGPGIPLEVRENMFEPFVTTKEVGKGTGLGLYVTREIIASMAGTIDHGDCALGGAQFTIEIPLSMIKE